MNELIKELYAQSEVEVVDTCDYNGMPFVTMEFDPAKFADLIIREYINLLYQEWYALNNAVVPEDESPRDVGFRVGQKAEVIRLIAKIKQHFGVTQ